MTQSNISNKIDKGIESSSKVGSAWAGEGGVGGVLCLWYPPVAKCNDIALSGHTADVDGITWINQTVLLLFRDWTSKPTIGCSP